MSAAYQRRLPLDGSARRRHRSICLTDAEHAEVQRAAARDGVSVNRWMVEALGLDATADASVRDALGS